LIGRPSPVEPAAGRSLTRNGRHATPELTGRADSLMQRITLAPRRPLLLPLIEQGDDMMGRWRLQLGRAMERWGWPTTSLAQDQTPPTSAYWAMKWLTRITGDGVRGREIRERRGNKAGVRPSDCASAAKAPLDTRQGSPPRALPKAEALRLVQVFVQRTNLERMGYSSLHRLAKHSNFLRSWVGCSDWAKYSL